MAQDDQAEQILEQPKESQDKSDLLSGKDLIEAAKELASSVKSDLEERKQDYDTGKRRNTSSYEVLKDLALSLFDGDKKLVGKAVEMPGLASDSPAAKAGEADGGVYDKVGQGDFGTIGRKVSPLDVENLPAPPSDATKTTRTDDDGYKVETLTKNGETVKTEIDDQGRVTYRQYQLKDGGNVQVDYDPDTGKPSLPVINHKDGTTTDFHRDADGKLVGEHRSADGKLLDKVNYIDGKLIYDNVKTHEKRAVSFEAPTDSSLAFQVTDLGKYDANTGTITADAKTDLVQSFARGSYDMVSDSGMITGFSVNGDISYANPKTGDASVIRADGTGVVLHGDGTIDRWGPKPGDTVSGEKLSPQEQAYLKKHPEVDLRDVAEIHERFKGDQSKLDSFYKSLEKLDSAKNLNTAEKAAIRTNLLEHVAHPDAIYQGVTDSCNVSVIQRDLIINSPDKYVSTVVTAVSDGKIKLADGTEVKLDVNNLKMADSSGRDLASRIFQTAALHAEFHPTKNFVNTADGIGALKPGKDDPRGTKPIPFDGLYPAEIAEVRHKLTGEDKAVTFVKTEGDLRKALDENGGPPMTIMVDATHEPFGEGDSAPTAPNHVVTIVGIENGPPVKYMVQNQYGLEHDHSSTLTAIPADKLLENMSRHKEVNASGTSTLSTDKGAIVISKGDHKSAYTIIDGTRTERTDIASNLQQSNRSTPRVAGRAR